MAYYGNILEEELKNKVAQDLFEGFDTTQIIGRIDFCVSWREEGDENCCSSRGALSVASWRCPQGTRKSPEHWLHGAQDHWQPQKKSLDTTSVGRWQKAV